MGAHEQRKRTRKDQCSPLITVEIQFFRATSTLERGVLTQPIQPRVEFHPLRHLESAIVLENVGRPEHP